MKKIELKWENMALILIVILSLILTTLRRHSVGYGNNYYAAAVKSMLTSWHNFFFVSYDPGGFVSVDKPPLGLWLQTVSAYLFGFKGWNLLLPQALASVVSVVLIYCLVRKAWGHVAGLLSAFILATTPIFVAVSRTNELDPVLVMIILFAAWAVNIAAEKGTLRWLIVAMILAGLGFNTKMLEAYMVLPAFYLVYLLSPSLKMNKKIVNLIVSTVVLLAVSLSWAFMVDFTPPENRPYVGNSKNNSVISLAIDYNGIKRLLPGKIKYDLHGNVNKEGGEPGLFRLFNRKMAGQISWLLPLALFGLIVSIERLRRKGSGLRNPERQSVIFWGAWVVPMMVYFSITGFFQRYYLSMLAPGMAALTGIGMVELWKSYHEDGWLRWMLPASLLGDVSLQMFILTSDSKWAIWMIPMAFGLCFFSAVVLIELKARNYSKNRLVLKAATIIGLAALFIAPSLWAITPILYGDQMVRPFAGPELKSRHSKPWNEKTKMTKLIHFLLSNKKNEKFLVAVHSATIASPIILETGQPVMAMGGYADKDNILTVEKVRNLVNEGKVRYFFILKIRNKKKHPQMWKLDHWITKNGKLVPQELWRGNFKGNDSFSKMLLYDCQPKHYRWFGRDFITILKTLPRSGSLSTSIRPPWASTISLASVSPKPNPFPGLLERSPR
jgi:4-amino-4-deoxy-L-arabinose transferase-like glycosyltransferase